MRALLLAAALAVVGASCKRASSGGAPPPSGDAPGSSGGDTVSGQSVPEYEPCTIGVDSCDGDLVCVSAGSPNVGTCRKPCSLAGGGECTAAERCVPTVADPDVGACARAAAHFRPCGFLDVCGSDAYCGAAFGSTLCVPICDVGSLVGKTAVASCPAPPPELSGESASCRPITLGTASASLCIVEVVVGGLCDGLALACDGEGSRGDTDFVLEGGALGIADPGALACLPTAAGYRCMRVCSNDGGVNEASCTCPVQDAACADPSDPGLSWACTTWAGLGVGVQACVPLEPCVSEATCDDNLSSGLTRCDSSPYSGISGLVCVSP